MALSIKLKAIIMSNYASSPPPRGSIYYIVTLRVHVWCTKVLWVYNNNNNKMEKRAYFTIREKS